MKVVLGANALGIQKALDAFRPSYHADFLEVRARARRLLDGELGLRESGTLATRLRQALSAWGAGRRGAPCLKASKEMDGFLRQERLLNRLRRWSTITPGFAGSKRALIGQRQVSTSQFDDELILTLNEFAEGLFVGNTNVTYPMKAVLLITGIMPAFDSQVRRGMQRGGFAGMASTQFRVPTNPESPGGRKITRLPFLLGELWRRNADELMSAISRSSYPQLESEPGRVFDILLFMQAQETSPVILRLETSKERSSKEWYEMD